ncbi:hypothetical protein LF1_39220 [Rubripirellula obstinata]|uniref:Uncharacterized protein n=1 Tax=Rubripirellula obstinata TaxID=406547 RepID=A0A5B1CN73_9BACT|nr:hypothetical protein [Rubripirellula obstinata]KAA1261375.1 hypothetical protein LF1_39220 [Rubripirellula obstinata]
MGRQAKRSTEKLYLIAVILPPVLLVGSFIADLSLRSRAKKEVINQVELLSPQVRGISQSRDRLEEKLSPATTADFPTADWYVIARSGERFSSALVHDVTDAKELVPPGQEWLAAPLIEKLVDQERPLLDRLSQLIDDEAASQSNQDRQTDVRLPLSILPPVPTDMLRRAFQVAYHRGEMDRCLKLLELMLAAYGQLGNPQIAASAARHFVYPLLKPSLQYNVWNADQLAKLREIAEPLADVRSNWIATMESMLARKLDTLSLDGSSLIDGSSAVATNDQAPFETDPRHILQVLDFYESMIAAKNPGTMQHIDRVREIDNDYYNHQLPGFSLTSMPFAVALDSPVGQRLVGAYRATDSFESVIQHKLIIAAIAVRQYQAKTGDMPTQISDLRKVGLTSEDWRLFGSETLLIEGSNELLKLSTIHLKGWLMKQRNEATNSSIVVPRTTLEMWSGAE